MKHLKTFIFLLLVLLIFYASFSVIPQGEAGVLLRFGSLVKNKQTNQPLILKSGVHWVVPFFSRIKKFDLRLQDTQFISSPIAISDEKNILVNYYLTWQISDLIKFLAHDPDLSAMPVTKTLHATIEENLQTALQRHAFSEIIVKQGTELDATLIAKINAKAKNLGIKILALNITKIDYPPMINDIILQRMQKKYTDLAKQYQTESNAQATSIRAQADADTKIKLAEAEKQATKIRATGDSKAMSIYQTAYQQNEEFYRWYKKLEIYKKIFANGGNVLVLQPNGELFRLENKDYTHR